MHTVAWDASGVASGVYFYEMKGGEFRAVKKTDAFKVAN